MRKHRYLTALAVATVIAGFGPSIARAGVLTIAAQDAAGASSSPFVLDNPGSAHRNGFVSDPLNGIGIGGAVVTFPADNSQPRSGIYDGSSDNAASPFSGTKLTATNYFVAEPYDQININFASAQTQFDLLWGDVNTHNSVSIKFCNNNICGSAVNVTGSEIAAAIGDGFFANGTTSAFVELSDTSPFNEIIFQTSCVPFEFVPAFVPEPISLGILATGLLGLATVR